MSVAGCSVVSMISGMVSTPENVSRQFIDTSLASLLDRPPIRIGTL